MLSGLEAFFAEFRDAVGADYPKFLSPILIGGIPRSFDPRFAVALLVKFALSKYRTFSLSPLQMESVVELASIFFEKPTFQYSLLGPVSNLTGPVEISAIEFPDGVILRPIPDEDLGNYYGTSVGVFDGPSPTWIFEKKVEIEKRFIENLTAVGPNNFSVSNSEFISHIRALAGFWEGPALGCPRTFVVASDFSLLEERNYNG